MTTVIDLGEFYITYSAKSLRELKECLITLEEAGMDMESGWHGWDDGSIIIHRKLEDRSVAIDGDFHYEQEHRDDD